jgi:hypothetical protein
MKLMAKINNLLHFQKSFLYVKAYFIMYKGRKYHFKSRLFRSKTI